jgi:BASS family bile acid:Na+ symporter
VWLVALVLFVGLVLRPLVGWGLAEVFALGTASYIVMLLLASCPGAPLGVKFAMSAKGDLTIAASMQVLLAVIGSITFPLVANGMIGAAGLGDDFSLPVKELILTVAFLQLVPFAVGIAVRHWTPDTAASWKPTVSKVANITLLLVLALALLGSWETILNMFGDFTLIAEALFVVIMIALGYFLSTGDKATRKATGLIQPGTNSGPTFAAVAIAFHNDPEILGIATALIFLQILVGVFVASYMGRKGDGEGEGASAEASAAVDQSVSGAGD